MNEVIETDEYNPLNELAISNKFKNVTDNEIRNEEEQDRMIVYLKCNCKEEEKLISTHFCQECVQGFCSICVKAHQRFKLTKLHNLKIINHFCECKIEEKRIASKYCQECSEVFCADCVIAHQRLIITRFHALSDLQ